MVVRHLCIVVVTLSTLVGCGVMRKSKPQIIPPATDYYVHTVNFSGETLGIIANWYTGRPGNWRSILQHNRGLEVRRIRVGDRIRIPSQLMQTRETLSQAFVSQHRMPKVRFAAERASGRATSYPYPVSSIGGCEKLGDSFEALEACIQRVSKELDLD